MGENVTIWFRWAVTDAIRGDVGPLHLPFSFTIAQGPKNVENESLLDDNTALVAITVSASSNYSLERFALFKSSCCIVATCQWYG